MGMRIRTLLLIVGLMLLPSAVRAQALLDAPVASGERSSTWPHLGGAAQEVPVLFQGSLSSMRFNREGLDVGLQAALWNSTPPPAARPDLSGTYTPAPVIRGQMTDVPPVIFTGPLSHPRYDDAGWFVGSEGLLYSTNRPLVPQSVAVRGFRDLDGAITGTPGTFVGSGEEALNTEQLMGPGTQQVGWNMFFGYRFANGLAVEFSWMHLIQATYHASASLISPSFNTGNAFENTFLFSPVSNFSTFWAGPAQKVVGGGPGTTLGIWNAASMMQIEFIQRFDIYQINARIPVVQTADYRGYGIFGPRIAWVWDQFRWSTTDIDTAGNIGDTAIYSNYVSNRMYGVHFGWGHDWWLGDTPIGGFAFTFEGEGAVYVNMVKTNAQYVLVDGNVSSGRSGHKTTLVPGAEARIGLWWYPWEAISLNVGYDVITFFNTMSSQKPIDFNLGQVDPAYNYQFFRYFQGLRFGITFVF